MTQKKPEKGPNWVDLKKNQIFDLVFERDVQEQMHLDEVEYQHAVESEASRRRANLLHRVYEVDENGKLQKKDSYDELIP